MNVTGQEVATGLADPLNMFIVFGVIVVIGVIFWGIWELLGK